uniref:Metalloendopeptidase n=1 Tax=Erpetoichthys calabaricus TaxID=27687 RepID=A0A8C4RTR2_ERPCA
MRFPIGGVRANLTIYVYLLQVQANPLKLLTFCLSVYMACNCSFSLGNLVMLRELDIRRVINRNAMKCFDSSTDCFWSKSSDGTVYVPYTISSAFNDVQRSTILDAMKTFASETCVQFIPQTNEVDYVSIESDVGCYAYIGKIGGAQTVSLDVNGCVYNGVIQHELNHALGFVHEHTRSDRDLYVEIIWEYISEDEVQNFEKQDTNNLGTPYDYSSVMHYSNYAFTNVSGMATIVPIPDPTVPIGQRQGLSPIDIERINLLYTCNSKAFLTPSGSQMNANSNARTNYIVFTNLFFLLPHADNAGPTEFQLNGTLGTFTSPNYPSPYPMNANYLYLIHIPSGQVSVTRCLFG